MVAWLNDTATNWYHYIVMATVQNTIYVAGLMFLIYLLRNKDIRFLRMLTIIGLIKLAVPPFIQPDKIGQLAAISTKLPSVYLTSVNTAITGDPGISLYAWLLIGWVFVIVLLIAVIIKNSLLLRIKCRQARKIEGIKIPIDSLRKRVQFFVTNHSHSPFLVGFIRYSVFLPRDWPEWSVECKDAVITHELTHISQKDPWLNLGRMIVLILNFYNPLVWLLSRKFCHLSEMICDDYTSYSMSTNHLLYSKHLIEISEKVVTGRLSMNASLAFSESYKIMKERISHQLNRKEEYLMKNLNSRYKFGTLFTALIMFLFSWQLIGSGIADEKIYVYGAIDKNPELVEQGKPKYPELARKNGIQGEVEIIAIIDEKGNVIETTIGKSIYATYNKSEISSADKNLTEDEIKKICTLVDYACIEAAKATKFKAGEHSGEKVKVKFAIPYTFRLK